MTAKSSLFKSHCERWRSGCGSDQCDRAKRIVLARGTIPCDVLFVGEAPGESEDVLGAPFVGPAGKLLDQIVRRGVRYPNRRLCCVCRSFQWDTPNGSTCHNGHAGEGWDEVRVAFTNLVGCIPREEDGGKATEPDDAQVKSCSARLVEFVEIANPRLIVRVGKNADDWLTPGYKHSVKFHREIRQVSIVHPAAILRSTVASQGLAIQRCVVTLSNAVEEL